MKFGVKMGAEICLQIKSLFSAFWGKILSAFGMSTPGLYHVQLKYFIESSSLNDEYSWKNFVESLS